MLPALGEQDLNELRWGLVRDDLWRPGLILQANRAEVPVPAFELLAGLSRNPELTAEVGGVSENLCKLTSRAT
jgi:hypothetical protein